MTSAAAKHVFISYVRQDSAEVDKLCDLLKAANIAYWRDRESLGPGDAWKRVIRDAIQDGTAVFLACFSANQRAKEKSVMNEEIGIAVEEYRLRRRVRPGSYPSASTTETSTIGISAPTGHYATSIM